MLGWRAVALWLTRGERAAAAAPSAADATADGGTAD
jgi:hypothetical protein